jgi:Fe-S oxidoreductase
MLEGDKCKACNTQSCLMKCQYIDISQEDAKLEIMKIVNGENSRILSECVTCFACQEYCEYNARPFDRIMELQEKYNSLNIPEEDITKAVTKFGPHEELRIKEIDPEKPVFNKCTFRNMNKNEMTGQLFDNLQYLSGTDFFCNLMYHHMARDSIVKERAPLIIENFKKHGVKELICWHDECYGFFASYCPRNGIEVPFKAIHLFEYLYNYLKARESELKKLAMKIAYLRNCSNRFIPETDQWVDKLCELIGLERVPRKYDRENALCCGGCMEAAGDKKKLRRETQRKNVQDMIDFGAEAVVFNCPMCKNMIGSAASRKGLKTYLMSDLCRLALGEELDYIK